MLQKLEPCNYDILNRFPDLCFFPMIHAVCLGIQQGNVFVDDAENLNAIFVTNTSGFSYLYTEPTFNDFKGILDFFLKNDEIPQYFHIYHPPFKLTQIVLSDDTIGYKLRDRIQLKYNSDRSLPTVKDTAEIIKIEIINEKNIDDIVILGEDFVGKYWHTKKGFFTNGYGVIAYGENNSPISVCYTASVADKTSEIDIFTKPEYRGKGIGQHVTSMFVKTSIQKGVTANWDCFEDNTGSLKIATSVGFEPTKKYKFLSIYLKNKADANK